MDKERKGLPSSSSMDRYNSCSGSLPLERLLRKRGELPKNEDNDAASHGRLIHAICDEIFFTRDNLEPGRYSKAHLDEAQAYVNAARTLAVQTWGDDEEGPIKFYLERRLYLRDESGTAYSTGKPDVVMVKDQEAILIDYKTGWGQLPFAGDSWQLKSYAVMAAQEYDVESVKVAFIKQGAVESEHTLSEQDLYDLTVFVLPGILLKRNENPFVETSYSPDPDTCRYCACKLKCPALNAQFMIMEPRKEVSDVFLPELDNSKLEEMKEALGQLEAFSKALDAEISSRLQDDPDSFESWHMGPGRGRRTVKDPSSLCGQLIEDGASPEDIYEVLKIGVTDAEKLHKKITQLKGKMAKSDFNSRYGNHIETVPGRETLKRKPPAIEEN